MAMTAESLRAPLLFVIDVGNGLIQQPIRPQLMKGDKKANTIIVRVMDGNEPVDLTGATVTGSFISPVDGAEIPLTGSVSGNEASVILADACYAEDGYFEANVKLTVGETARTILSITGSVLSNGSGAVIDIGNVIPSIDDIIAQYAAMKQAVEDANAARDAANTAAGNAGTAAQNAENAVTNANNAATNANNAAAKIDGMTVSAVSGTSAAASISEQNGAKHISFTLPKGDKGEQGAPGNTPYIGSNGNWWIGNTDTGTSASGSGGVADSVAWEDVTGKPETYPPASHTHTEYLGKNETAANATQLNGKSANAYMLKTDTAADSEKLNGKSAADLMLEIYPVGSIYMSVNSTSPASLFGGTWEQLKDRFLLGAGDSYAAGTTGGEATHTLTKEELPVISGSVNFNRGNSRGIMAETSGVLSVSQETTNEGVPEAGTENQAGNYRTLNINFGSGQAHNNMPPYLAVYMWKRVS